LILNQSNRKILLKRLLNRKSTKKSIRRIFRIYYQIKLINQLLIKNWMINRKKIRRTPKI